MSNMPCAFLRSLYARMLLDCLHANTLLFLHVPSVSDPSDSQNWGLMFGIKANILRRMDSAAPGVRICCVKFLQQVVLVQTPGVADPRVDTPPTLRRRNTKSHVSQRADHNDISLSIVPRDHPLIPYASLEAEGHGLLDRLLDIIHGDHRLDRQSQAADMHLTQTSDGLLVTATLNSLGMLIHRRPNAANKILNSVFNFNPLKLANSPMTPKNKVIIKSIERTTRALLVNIMKRYVNLRMSRHLKYLPLQEPREPNQWTHTTVPGTHASCPCGILRGI